MKIWVDGLITINPPKATNEIGNDHVFTIGLSQVANGVTSFDVASIPEIELVAAHAPGARLAFMHPVKSRSAIRRAYADFGVRTFAFDTHEELTKILEETGGARD